MRAVSLGYFKTVNRRTEVLLEKDNDSTYVAIKRVHFPSRFTYKFINWIRRIKLVYTEREFNNR